MRKLNHLCNVNPSKFFFFFLVFFFFFFFFFNWRIRVSPLFGTLELTDRVIPDT